MSTNSVRVMPLGAQVVFFSEPTNNLPDWETGSEAAVSNETSILIATREDIAGDVEYQVSEGARDSDGKILVYECDLDLGTGTVKYGSILSNELFVANLQASGIRNVQVFADSTTAPSSIEVCIN